MEGIYGGDQQMKQCVQLSGVALTIIVALNPTSLYCQETPAQKSGLTLAHTPSPTLYLPPSQYKLYIPTIHLFINH